MAYNAASDEFLVVWERWNGADRDIYGHPWGIRVYLPLVLKGT